VKAGDGMTAPLRQREFRLLFSGQLVSNLGDWLDYLALAVLIAYVWDYGAAALAALAVVIAVPHIFVAPFAGVWVDRWPKRAVMIGADLARAAAVLGLVFAPTLAVVLVLVALKTTFATFFNPAEQTAIRLIVPESQLHSANALSQFVLQSTKVAGPALGGLLVAATSPRVAFAVDAGTFLASAAILSRLSPLHVPRAAPESAVEGVEAAAGGYWHELREGLAYIFSRRALIAAIAAFSAAVFLLLAFDALSPLAFRELGVGRAVFGLAIGAIGLGGVLGAIAVGRYGGAVNPFVLMGGAKVIIGALVALMGGALLSDVDVPAGIWVPVLLVIGVASAGVLISAPTIIQRETPPELMGRVTTSATSIPTGFQMFAPIAGAALAEWQSVGFVFALAGCGLAALGLIVLAVRPPVGVGVPVAAAAGAEVLVAGADAPAETTAVRR
jgi:MFS family permease